MLATLPWGAFLRNCFFLARLAEAKFCAESGRFRCVPSPPHPHPRGWQHRGECALIRKGAQCASELGPT